MSELKKLELDVKQLRSEMNEIKNVITSAMILVGTVKRKGLVTDEEIADYTKEVTERAERLSGGPKGSS